MHKNPLLTISFLFLALAQWANAAPSPATENAASKAKIIHVGPSQQVRTIAQAARIAKDGDIIEIEPGDYHRDVAIWTQDRLTIRGAGGRVNIIAGGSSAEGKAIWVIRGGENTAMPRKSQGQSDMET